MLEPASWKALIVAQKESFRRERRGGSLLLPAPLADAETLLLLRSRHRADLRVHRVRLLKLIQRRDIGLGARRNNIRIGSDTVHNAAVAGKTHDQIGRASCRERV